MKKKLIINSMLGILGASTLVVGTALSLASCHSSQPILAKEIYKNYTSELNQAIGNKKYYQITAENKEAVLNVIKKYLNETNKQIENTHTHTVTLMKL